MTELSGFWSGTATGDATSAPYSDDFFSDYWRKLFLTDRTVQGVLRDYANELSASGATSPVVVATGAGINDGKFYESDANVSHTISTPAGATRIDRIVLRKIWASQTVRQVVITGVEGGGAPALTQNDGNTWDVPLWQVSITTGGAITLTDERTFCQTPLAPGNAVLAYDVVTAETTVVSSAAETTVYTQQIDADDLGTNKLMRYIMWFSWANTSGANQWLRLRVKYGATTLLSFFTDAGGNELPTGNTAYGYVDVVLKADAATNAQEAIGTCVSKILTDYGLTPSTVAFHKIDQGTAAEDSTTDLNFVVTAQLKNANANLSFTTMSSILEGPFAP